MSTEHEDPAAPRARGIYLLPNLFTLTALFAGFYAIIASIKGLFDDACVALFVSLVMDALDGRVARLTHTQTEFGAQLDSMSDMVCFGLAPALMLYIWGLHAFGKAGWLIAFVYAACVALRLARFNVQHHQMDKRYFRGLPCPAAASVLISALWSIEQYHLTLPVFKLTMAVVTVLMSLLMVSNVFYHSFKDFNPRNKVPFIVILLVLLFFVIISVDPPFVWFMITALYALSGLLLSLHRLRKKKK